MRPPLNARRRRRRRANAHDPAPHSASGRAWRWRPNDGAAGGRLPRDSHQRLKARVVPELAPVRAVLRREALAVLRVQREIPLEQANRFVLLTQLRADERLLPEQVAVLVDLGRGAGAL